MNAFFLFIYSLPSPFRCKYPDELTHFFKFSLFPSEHFPFPIFLCSEYRTVFFSVVNGKPIVGIFNNLIYIQFNIVIYVCVQFNINIQCYGIFIFKSIYFHVSIFIYPFNLIPICSSNLFNPSKQSFNLGDRVKPESLQIQCGGRGSFDAVNFSLCFRQN